MRERRRREEGKVSSFCVRLMPITGRVGMGPICTSILTYGTLTFWLSVTKHKEREKRGGGRGKKRSWRVKEGKWRSHGREVEEEKEVLYWEGRKQ